MGYTLDKDLWGPTNMTNEEKKILAEKMLRERELYRQTQKQDKGRWGKIGDALFNAPDYEHNLGLAVGPNTARREFTPDAKNPNNRIEGEPGQDYLAGLYPEPKPPPPPPEPENIKDILKKWDVLGPMREYDPDRTQINAFLEETRENKGSGDEILTWLAGAGSTQSQNPFASAAGGNQAVVDHRKERYLTAIGARRFAAGVETRENEFKYTSQTAHDIARMEAQIDLYTSNQETNAKDNKSALQRERIELETLAKMYQNKIEGFYEELNSGTIAPGSKEEAAIKMNIRQTQQTVLRAIEMSKNVTLSHRLDEYQKASSGDGDQLISLTLEPSILNSDTLKP